MQERIASAMFYCRAFIAIAKRSCRSIDYSNGTISSATMLMILINGLMAGPAVSL
jgi:hypothetical protein